MDESVLAHGATITPDAALVERARHGDTSAFEALIADRLDRCYRIAWSILANDVPGSSPDGLVVMNADGSGKSRVWEGAEGSGASVGQLLWVP